MESAGSLSLPESWQNPQQQLRNSTEKWALKTNEAVKEWRATSPTVRCLRTNAQRFQQSCDALKRGFLSAQKSGAGAKIRAYLKAYKLTASKNGVKVEELSAFEHSQDIAADLTRLAQRLNSRQDSYYFFSGVLLFGALLFILGAAPWALPYVFLLFFTVAFPWRIHHFCSHKWGFFLLDFC